MAQRAVSLRYHGLKVAQAIAVISQQLSTAGGSLPVALAKGVEAYKRQLTSVMVLAGVAMAPTFNSPKRTATKDRQGDESVEHLLLRLIPRPSGKTVFTDDVVAFTSPFAASAVAPIAAPGSVMVRRVAAVEGDEMVSDDAEEEGFQIPQGHCWVLADNPELEPPHVIDSRSFGPLPFSSILGRVMYSARSEKDHGPVENSPEGIKADGPVLDAELDLERLCQGEDGESGLPEQ
ncbi:hypothetical protein N2152v2_006582 [Parachlorella kessleri]